MTEHEVSFTEALALEGDGGTYRGTLHASWAQGRASFGGLVGGLLLRGLERALGAQSARSPRSLLIDFVAPAAPGEFTIRARLLRSGKALTHAHAELVQGNDVCAVITGVFAEPRQTSISLTGPSAPSMPAPDAVQRFPYLEGVMPRFTKYFDFRYVSELPFSGSGDGSIRGYVRHDRPVPLDQASLLALIDTWPPSVLPMLKRPAPASSVTWMVDFLAPPPVAQDDAFVQYEARTVHAQSGYASAEARVWSADGTLLAASRQLTAEFS